MSLSLDEFSANLDIMQSSVIAVSRVLSTSGQMWESQRGNKATSRGRSEQQPSQGWYLDIGLLKTVIECFLDSSVGWH